MIFELEWTGKVFGKEFVRAGKWECTQTQASTLDERPHGTKPGPLSLEFLSMVRYGLNIKQLAPVDRKHLDKVPLPNVLEYNALDARTHCKLAIDQRKDIKEQGLSKAHGYMLRRVPALALSQLKGLPVSQKYVRDLDRKYTTRIAETKKEIAAHKHAKLFKQIKNREFGPLAPKDAIELYRDILKRKEVHLEVKAKDINRKQEAANQDFGSSDEAAEDQKDSANKAVLKAIGGRLPNLILRVREANKRHSSYVIKMMAGHDKSKLWPDGLIHPVFNTWKARTGRMSAEEPSVQNWPKRDGEAREVRKPIVADKDCMIIAVDYGQIEARVIAMYTKTKPSVRCCGRITTSTPSGRVGLLQLILTALVVRRTSPIRRS